MAEAMVKNGTIDAGMIFLVVMLLSIANHA